MRLERIGVDRGHEPCWQDQFARNELQGLGEKPVFRFQESIELARIANRHARDASLHPASKLARKPVTKHGLHTKLAHGVECLAQQIEAAKACEILLKV